MGKAVYERDIGFVAFRRVFSLLIFRCGTLSWQGEGYFWH